MTHGRNTVECERVCVPTLILFIQTCARWSPAPMRAHAVRKWRATHLSVADKMSAGQRWPVFANNRVFFSRRSISVRLVTTNIIYRRIHQSKHLYVDDVVCTCFWKRNFFLFTLFLTENHRESAVREYGYSQHWGCAFSTKWLMIHEYVWKW